MKATAKTTILIATHAVCIALGFAGGIYTLPLLIAPPGPSAAELQAASATAQYRGILRRDLAGSDALHWGEGEITLDAKAITLKGRLTPGPDFKLYLSPQFVETEADFKKLKSSMVLVGDVRTFDGFIVPLTAGADLTQFNTVVVWCESFEKFISSAQFR